MEPESLGSKSFKAGFWVFGEKLGTVTTNFFVTLVLARLLDPEDFGLIAAVIIVFELSMTFVNSGFSAALIRENVIQEIDKSTAFLFNVIAAIILYFLLFISAPLLANFFKSDLLIPIIRVMGLNLIIGSFAIVQKADLSHKINFQTQARARLSAIVCSGIVAIIMAMNGFGVWSLVAKFLLTAFFDTIILWFIVGWRPLLQFSMASFNKLFDFGWKFLLMVFLDKLFIHMFKILIGRFFSATTLGFYYFAENLRNMVTNGIFQTFQKVSYPVLSKFKDDPSMLKNGYKKFIKLCFWLIAPVTICMIVLAEPMITILYGEKWIKTVPILQLLCISGLVLPINAINLNMLLVLGRSDLGLRIELIKKSLIVVAIVIGISFGLYGLIIGEVITAYIALFISAYYSKRFLKYSLADQVRDLYYTLIFSFLIGILAFYLHYTFNCDKLWELIVILMVLAALYVLLHIAFKTDDIHVIQNRLISKVLPKMKRQKKRTQDTSVIFQQASTDTGPVVSISMTAYNVEAYIAAALEGILKQKTNFDFEIVIGEDCSSDNTKTICRQYADKYPDIIRLIEHPKNLGIAGNTLSVWKNCHGTYIAICDADDIWIDNRKLEKQVNFLNDNPDYGMIFSDVKLIDENGNEYDGTAHDHNKYYKSGTVFFDLLHKNYVNNSTSIFRKEIIGDFEAELDRNYYSMDYLFWLHLSAQSKIKYLDEKTTAYRKHANAATQSTSMQEKNKQIFLENLPKLLLYFDRNYKWPVTREQKTFLYRKLLSSVLRKCSLKEKLRLAGLSFKYFPGIRSFIKAIK